VFVCVCYYIDMSRISATWFICLFISVGLCLFMCIACFCFIGMCWWWYWILSIFYILICLCLMYYIDRTTVSGTWFICLFISVGLCLFMCIACLIFIGICSWCYRVLSIYILICVCLWYHIDMSIVSATWFICLLISVGLCLFMCIACFIFYRYVLMMLLALIYIVYINLCLFMILYWHVDCESDMVSLFIF